MAFYSTLNPDQPQRHRLRNARTEREVALAGQPGRNYLYKQSGEPLEVVGRIVPVAPGPSHPPWAVENLRLCPTCAERVQKSLNHRPYDGRRLPPLDRFAEAGDRRRSG